MSNNIAAEPILIYLENMPGYPFDTDVDSDFVSELLGDFSSVDILDQIKSFRWHHAGRPAQHFRSLRPAIRRWLSSARRFDREHS